MPIMADDAVRDPAFVEASGKAFAANAVEMIAWRGDTETMTVSGGPLFSARVKAAAIRGNWHIWVDTHAIVNKPGGYLAGGRGDELAVAAGFPNEVFGFWAERGATMIQTDEPRAAINWLAANGYRVPYAELEKPRGLCRRPGGRVPAADQLMPREGANTHSSPEAPCAGP